MNCGSKLLKIVLVVISCCGLVSTSSAGRILQLVNQPGSVKAFAFPFTDPKMGVLVALDTAGQPRRFWLVEAESQTAEIPVEVQSKIFAMEGYRNAGSDPGAVKAANLYDERYRYIDALQAWPAVVSGVPHLEETMTRLLKLVKEFAGRPIQKIILTPDGAVILSASPRALKNMVAVDLLVSSGSEWRQSTIDYLPSGWMIRLSQDQSLREKVNKAGNPGSRHFAAFDLQTGAYVLNHQIVWSKQRTQAVLTLSEIRTAIKAAQDMAAVDEPPSAAGDPLLEAAFQLEIYEWGESSPATDPSGIAPTFLDLGLHQHPSCYRTTP